MAELKRTPLYEEHVRLGAKIVDFSGWEMPVYYSNVIEEHTTVRQKAGIFDICHMGEFLVQGKDAFNIIQNIITNDLNRLEDGKAFYSCMCLEDGGIIDDLFVYRFNEDKFMIVVNAGNVDKDFRWILKHKGSFDAEIINSSDKMSKIDLQGPKAKDILQKCTGFSLGSLKRFHFVEDNINNIPTIISRTGYTAEDGFELYFDAAKAAEVWNMLLEGGKDLGLRPIGLGARDTLRIEACYSLYGHEANERINPFEANVGFTVSFDKGDFVGKDALLKAKENLKRKVLAFEMLDRAIARENYEIFKGPDKIGFVTSGTFSPTFKKPLGMAMLNIQEARAGNIVDIKIRDSLHKAKVLERPIYGFNG
ncbi:glycine cleavage system aminomethyltransferase GcvT [Candidatus Woesearchaeota archaeon]|nr:glycine cleavage system aminomethyltransferase GcvT [Candidatus Woesearchaeota archaeon]